jgi:hypothetical protein
MKAQRITPDICIEGSTAADLLDGVNSINISSRSAGGGTILPPPGKGPNVPLSLAIQEVATAAHTEDSAEVEQLCTNAVMNSRRALACLVDWYIERDLARYCKNPPNTPKQQADYLTRRGIIDELTSHVLERAIGKRNRVEHDYIIPNIAEAEDIVELLRRTIAMLRSQSDPSLAPMLHGFVLSASGYREQGPYAEFHGWSEPLVIFYRFSKRPWAGLLIPESATKALLRQTFLDQTDTQQLIQLLSLADQKFGKTLQLHWHKTMRGISRGNRSDRRIIGAQHG